ncbi:hypothetical protein PAECIP111893_01793 [Paenibacillus plantiphilus]|uniref:Uncharacterized protein n=1 Tax=Paenibacillus plantiphilus TaxID=2905650 RepID=A0ABN8GGF6_9BACL|nr:hypothetical protein [Paenibacillus plantiphilus]CAH1202462.1 hypothetical protein PAECIP111893_01793 [Paenibacillus plantiphilus]
MRGIVDEAVNVSGVLQAAASDEIHVYESDGGKEKTLFKGTISTVQTKHANGVYEIEIEGLSGTYLMDMKRHRRTYQNTAMSYSALVVRMPGIRC